MSQELLCDLVGHRDQTCAARRRWYVLPLSIAVHGLLAAVILIVPLAATVDLPSPPSVARLTHVISAMPVPSVPTAPAGTRTAARPTPQPSFSDVPRTAPSGLRPERPIEAVPGALPGPTVESGFGGVGVIPGGEVKPVQPVEPPRPVRHPPVPIGGSIRAPVKMGGPAPVYPIAALQARLEGTVVLEAVIDERGNVEHLRVVKSSPLFDRAAFDAVSRWRYTPTLLNAVPVPVLMTVTVNFRLSR